MEPVKRFEMYTYGCYSASEVGMELAEHGEYVLYEDYAALLQKLEASEALMLAMRDDSRESRSRLELLAAENAAMKAVLGPGEAVMNFLTIALRHTTYDEIDLNDVALAFKLSLPDVPATDAMVNEIRAEGVHSFIAYLGELAKEWPQAMVAKSLEITELNAESFIQIRLLRDDAAKGGSDEPV